MGVGLSLSLPLSFALARSFSVRPLADRHTQTLLLFLRLKAHESIHPSFPHPSHSQHRRKGEGESEVMTLVRRHQKLVMHARSPRVVAPQAHDLRVQVE